MRAAGFGLAFAVGVAARPSAAGAAGPNERDAVEEYRGRYRRVQLAGMGVLTGWALANIGVGVAGSVVIEGEGRFFHQMNAMWNSVNLTLGIVGLVSSGRRLPSASDADDARRLYRKVRRVYAINGALDVLYISGGVLTAELGRRYGSGRIEGYGRAVVFQGAFLMAFDLAMLLAHERTAANLPNVRIGPKIGTRTLGLTAAGSF